jgi:bifunctional non-homologous end joining protein LigD
VSTEPGQRFVLHEHFAKHHHFDLRLEHDGVLASWAVPKGLPEKSGERRLAIAVEDHAREYIGFEGTIPKVRMGPVR